jgi:hypothetical protein
MHTFITSMDDQNALQHFKYCNAGILQTTRCVDTKCQQSSTCQQQANWAALAAAAFASVPMRPLRLRRAAKGGEEVASNCPGLLGGRIRVDQYGAQPSPGLQGYLTKTCWPLNCFTKGRVCVTVGRNVGSAAFGGIAPDTKVQ